MRKREKKENCITPIGSSLASWYNGSLLSTKMTPPMLEPLESG